MYVYRGPRDLEGYYMFASQDFWKSKNEDVWDIPVLKVIIKEEDMTPY
jgi:hypothetical protein